MTDVYDPEFPTSDDSVDGLQKSVAVDKNDTIPEYFESLSKDNNLNSYGATDNPTYLKSINNYSSEHSIVDHQSEDVGNNELKHINHISEKISSIDSQGDDKQTLQNNDFHHDELSNSQSQPSLLTQTSKCSSSSDISFVKTDIHVNDDTILNRDIIMDEDKFQNDTDSVAKDKSDYVPVNKDDFQDELNDVQKVSGELTEKTTIIQIESKENDLDCSKEFSNDINSVYSKTSSDMSTELPKNRNQYPDSTNFEPIFEPSTVFDSNLKCKGNEKPISFSRRRSSRIQIRLNTKAENLGEKTDVGSAKKEGKNQNKKSCEDVSDSKESAPENSQTDKKLNVITSRGKRKSSKDEADSIKEKQTKTEKTAKSEVTKSTPIRRKKNTKNEASETKDDNFSETVSSSVTDVIDKSVSDDCLEKNQSVVPNDEFDLSENEANSQAVKESDASIKSKKYSRGSKTVEKPNLEISKKTSVKKEEPLKDTRRSQRKRKIQDDESNHMDSSDINLKTDENIVEPENELKEQNNSMIPSDDSFNLYDGLPTPAQDEIETENPADITSGKIENLVDSSSFNIHRPEKVKSRWRRSCELESLSVGSEQTKGTVDPVELLTLIDRNDSSELPTSVDSNSDVSKLNCQETGVISDMHKKNEFDNEASVNPSECVDEELDSLYDVSLTASNVIDESNVRTSRKILSVDSNNDIVDIPTSTSQILERNFIVSNQDSTSSEAPYLDSFNSVNLDSSSVNNKVCENISGKDSSDCDNSDDSKMTANVENIKEEKCEPVVVLKYPDCLEDINGLPYFNYLHENKGISGRKKSKDIKEVKRMVCDCILTKEEIKNGCFSCGDDCLNRLLMIECGSRCVNGDLCSNKRFQKREYVNVLPFKTEKKGWGLKTSENLSEGQFLMEYVGEILNHREFKQRVKQYSKDKCQHYYFMSLRADEILDATYSGNVSRFINHSCSPNVETQKWTVNGELRIGFFTIKKISRDEELTFDYQFQRYGREAQKCYCNSENCRGFIGGEKQVSYKTNKVLSSKKKKTAEEKKREMFEDMDLDNEIEKLNSQVGLRNRDDTLKLCRLMVRAEDHQHREILLNILQNTTEQACLRLFLDYHGLSLLWSWMADVRDCNVCLKTQILETLALLPISNKTTLEQSKVIDVVKRWASQLPVSVERKDSVEQESSLDGDTSSNESQDSSLSKQPEKCEQSESSGAVLSFHELNIISQPLNISVDDIPLPPSPSDELQSTDKANEENEDDSEPKNYSVSASPDISSTVNETKSIISIGDNIDTQSIESGAETKSDDDDNQEIEKKDGQSEEVVNLANKILESWSGLKELFKIPKRESDQKYNDKESGKSSYSSSNDLRRAHLQSPLSTHNLKQGKRTQKSNRSNADRINKHERRMKFALEMQQKDEEEAIRRQEELQRQQEEERIQKQAEIIYAAATAMCNENIYKPSMPDGSVFVPAQPPVDVNMAMMPPPQVAPENLGVIYNPPPVPAQPIIPPPSILVPPPVITKPDLQIPPPQPYIEMPPPIPPTTVVTPTAVSAAPVLTQVPTSVPTPTPIPGPIPAQIPTHAPVPAQVIGGPPPSHILPPAPQPIQQIPGPYMPGLPPPPNQFIHQSMLHAPPPTAAQVIPPPSSQPPPHYLPPQVPHMIQAGAPPNAGPAPVYYIQHPGGQPTPVVLMPEPEMKDHVPPPPSPPKAKKNKLPPNWKMAKDPEGNTYYYHAVTRKTQWEPPAWPLEEQPEPTYTGDKHKHSKKKSISTTTAAADTSSELVKKTKELFRAKISSFIVHCLNPFRKPDCKVGRITSTEDFKHLARKLTHFVMAKELKYCQNVEDLECNENVKHKAKDFVNKYLAKHGPVYKKEKSSPKQY